METAAAKLDGIRFANSNKHFVEHQIAVGVHANWDRSQAVAHENVGSEMPVAASRPWHYLLGFLGIGINRSAARRTTILVFAVHLVSLRRP